MVTQIFSNQILTFFLTVTVTVTSVTWLRLRRHMVRELHNYKVAWLRGYANFFKTNFKKCSTHVTVTSVTGLRLRLRRHMVRELHNFKVAWLRGYAVTWLHKFFQTKF